MTESLLRAAQAYADAIRTQERLRKAVTDDASRHLWRTSISKSQQALTNLLTAAENLPPETES